MKKEEIIQVDGMIIAEFRDHYCFSDGSREVWISKKHCYWDEINEIFSMPKWLAEEMGLI